MKKKQQMMAQQFKLRALNNPTSCSNDELLIAARDQSHQQASVYNQSTMNLVIQEINDFLELSAGGSDRVNRF